MRRGAAGDIVVLARLFAALAPDMRQRLLTAVVDPGAGVGVSPGDKTAMRRSGTPDAALVDVVNLLSGYADLTTTGKSEVFASAVELVAAMRIQHSRGTADAPVSEHDWLIALAADTYPDSGAASELLHFAAGVDPEWQQAIFPDGQYPIAGSPSDCEITSADGMLRGYEHIRWVTEGMHKPPEAADHLGIVVAKSAYTEWDGDAWVFDDDAWKAATRHATVMVFAELVAEWRSRFFHALIAGAVLKQDRC